MNPSVSLLPELSGREARRRRQGVTRLEWLMLLGLVVGFAVLLVAGALRSPMMKKAQKTRTELEEIERALVVTAREKRWQDGRAVDFEELKPEIRKKFKRLLEGGSDPLGNAYEGIVVGQLPGVPEDSFGEFSEVVPDGFWEPYGSAAEARMGIPRDY